ncbi:nucleotidyltransferase domain-containing protein [Salibacterium halotolerans]|uniref:Nucleotidyltransferase domain-containing protein n=1 Tax=Salibacterium halotolerans TaxID=1884432 RepID=A0A1I5XME6_9BACI|nr:nucleotidyltransferase domain-containing protein [Salibacterium halotolerans]SFQ33104.1 Nucleotidyltransferase domain-containing protein [Salibacterium halotolerans]
MNNSFGITDKSYTLIQQTLQKFPEIETVYIFGSRALGFHKKGSDIDLAVTGDAVTEAVRARLSTVLNEEIPIPYFVDVLHYEMITEEALQKHVDQEGKLFYEKILI